MLKATNAKLVLQNKRILLNRVTFSMQEAKLHYLHGPNGIGKTSLIKAILGIDFCLESFEKSFQSFFYLPQVQNKEFLFPFRVSEITSAGTFLTANERHTMWNNASGGQRKKALLERAFATECDLYVFDEPFNHLDKESIQELSKQLEMLVDKGKTVIMIGHKEPQVASHLMVKWEVSLWK